MPDHDTDHPAAGSDTKPDDATGDAKPIPPIDQPTPDSARTGGAITPIHAPAAPLVKAPASNDASMTTRRRTRNAPRGESTRPSSDVPTAPAAPASTAQPESEARATTPVPDATASSATGPVDVSIYVHSAQCRACDDPKGIPLYDGDFRVLDWQDPLRLAECTWKVMAVLTGKPTDRHAQNWLQLPPDHAIVGVTLPALRGVAGHDLYTALGALAGFLVRPSPVGVGSTLAQAQFDKIRQIAQGALRECGGREIKPAITIAVTGEVPLVLDGHWQERPKPKEPKKKPQVVNAIWDGERISRRTIYVLSGQKAYVILYDEHLFADKVRAMRTAAAADPDAEFRVAFESGSLGSAKGYVLTALEPAAAEPAEAAA